MLEITGNLFSTNLNGIRVITTNGTLTRDGRCVMGRGVALYAKKKFHELDRRIGQLIERNGNHSFLLSNIGLATFPVKHNFYETADIKLIKRSAEELVGLKINCKVFLPRPGCGNGNLRWEEVKPIIEPILVGNQYTIVHMVMD